jgi:hypothetical protein
MVDAVDLRRRADPVLRALTPHPHRGDLVAAGALPLALGVLVINARLDATWGTGVFLVLTGLACALVLGMGLLAPLEGERPRAYQTLLLVTGLALGFVTLLRLAQLLGVPRPLGSPGTLTWLLGIVVAGSAWIAHARRSAICALLAALAGIVLALAFVDWVFHPSGTTTFRWVLLAAAAGLVLGALELRERRRRESVYLIDAAGLAIALLAVTYAGALLHYLGPPFTAVGVFGVPLGVPGAGWKLVLLAAGLGLVAYAGVDREPGPAYVGTLNLVLWVAFVGIPAASGASLWFWPLALVLLGAAGIALGLRPRQPLPPEPRTRPDPPTEPLPGPGARGGSSSLWSGERSRPADRPPA